MTILNRIASNWSFQEREKLNSNWSIIESYLSKLQGQINILTGDLDVQEIVDQINEILNRGNIIISDLEAALQDVSTVITNVQNATIDAQNATNDANNATQEALNAVNDMKAFIYQFGNAETYDSTKLYNVNNIVEYNGSGFICIQDTQSNTPPTLPTKRNEWWQLIAQKGTDGTGAVSRVAGKSPESDGNVPLSPEDINAVNRNDYIDHLAQFKKLKNKANVNFLNVQQLNQVRYVSPKPMLVIEYDDGALEDYNLAFPIHKKYKVPATTNIITKLIGAEDQQGNTYMTKEQLIELYDNGWEISNHTARHNNLGEENLLVSANIGDIKIYPANAKSFRPDIGGSTNGIIIEDTTEEVVTFVSNGNDASGDYLIIESPLQNNFTTSAKFRLTDDELIYEILGAQSDLEGIGVEPNGIAYPYGIISPISRKIVASSHNAGRHIGKDADSINAGINDIRVKPLRTYGLYSSEFSLLTNEEISNALNETLLVNGLCIMYAHPYNSNFDVSKLEFLIQQAQSLGIDIVTRSEALLHFGNLLEIGDFIEEINNPYPSFLVVGQNREVYSGTMNVGNGRNLTLFTANNAPYIQGRNANLNIGSSNLSDLVLRTGDGTPFGSIETVRLRHQTNNIELSRNGGGIVFVSPNGAVKKKLTIDNSGTPVWTDI